MDGQHRLFIGKVHPSVDLPTLEQQLAPFGAANVRILAGKDCAFADFQSFRAAEIAIQALNGTKLTAECIEGLNVKFAEPKGAGGNTKFAEQKQQLPATPKVFIGGLAQATSDDHIYQVCCQIGTVVQTKIFAKGPETPPCAFVTFASLEEANYCISCLHDTQSELCAPGKTLNVRLADPTSKDNVSNTGLAWIAPAPVAGSFAGNKPMGNMNMPQAIVPRPPVGHVYSGGAATAHPGRPSFGGPGAPPPPLTCSQKLFVGGLPEAASEDFVWGLMAPFGEVVEVRIHRKSNAKPCGFVRFASVAEAEVAIASHSQLGKYTVKFADASGGAAAKRTWGAAFDTSGGVAC